MIMEKYIRKTKNNTYRIDVYLGTYSTLEEAKEIKKRFVENDVIKSVISNVSVQKEFTKEEEELLRKLNKENIPEAQQVTYFKDKDITCIRNKRVGMGLKFSEYNSPMNTIIENQVKGGFIRLDKKNALKTKN